MKKWLRDFFQGFLGGCIMLAGITTWLLLSFYFVTFGEVALDWRYARAWLAGGVSAAVLIGFKYAEYCKRNNL
jgi:hypothetical protein